MKGYYSMRMVVVVTPNAFKCFHSLDDELLLNYLSVTGASWIPGEQRCCCLRQKM